MKTNSTLREMGLGFKISHKKMETAVGKGFCRLVDERGSAAERNASLAAVDQVTELICSHDEPGTSKSGGRSLTCWISARNLFDVLPK